MTVSKFDVMKIFLMIFLVMMILSAKTFAQTQAFAVCNTGILESKYRIDYNPNDRNQRAVNSIADTISLEEAQSIFALNVIGRDTNKIFCKLSVRDFDMFIKTGTDTATYWCKGEMLTAEMKEALKKIRPGTEIFFERINAYYKELGSATAMIKYYVK